MRVAAGKAVRAAGGDAGIAVSAPAPPPPVCVDVAHPTIRFFGRGDSAMAPLVVTVLFTDPLGGQQELPVGLMLGGSRWTPSPVLAVMANLVASQVRFRLIST